MKKREKYFLDSDKIDHCGEVFDYIKELHEYLWRVVRIVNPGASGTLNDCLDNAISLLDTELQRTIFWEKESKRMQDSSDYYQKQLIDAHALLGRTIHQLSERCDSVNLTKYFPTDNLAGKRTLDNPSGK